MSDIKRDGVTPEPTYNGRTRAQIAALCGENGADNYISFREPDEHEEAAADQVYLPMDCPVCGRTRVEWNGKELRCEKCTTSSEVDGFSSGNYKADRDAEVRIKELEAALIEACDLYPRAWTTSAQRMGDYQRIMALRILASSTHPASP